jgi:hypothetical protein
MRAQHRVFWTPSVPPTSSSEEREALNGAQIFRPVIQTLRQQLYSPARVRGGLLFGFQVGDQLQVVLASSAGSSGWYRQPRRAVLEVDERFTLGWSEAVLSLFGGQIDWIGNWIAYPDSQLHSERRDLKWFKRGWRTGLFDDRSVLLVVGWNESVLDVQTYHLSSDGFPEALPCLVSPDRWPEKIRGIDQEHGAPQ